MLRKDRRSALRPSAGTASPDEIARFEALADEWWDAEGSFKIVHDFNDARVQILSQRLPRLLGRPPDQDRPLDGVSLVDVGCAAGIVTEPMARLGADVTAIDAAERNIAVAKRHAALSGLHIDYRHALPEDLADEEGRYDVLLTLEVVEHVADLPAFLSACAALLRPGGVFVVATLNRTLRSLVIGKFGAEYVLRVLPKGTHDWRKFVRPEELRSQLIAHGLELREQMGLAYNPITKRWRITRSVPVNYMQFYRKSGEGPLPPV